MKVSDLMTTAVFTLRLDKRVFIAEQIMGWAHIRHVPVVDSRNHVVGMISHRDILRASIASVSSKVAKLERRQHLSGIITAHDLLRLVERLPVDASLGGTRTPKKARKRPAAAH